MKKRKLGNTGIYLSEVGYGAAALFGKNAFGKQGITEEQAHNLISTAIRKGVTFFDTGINYGYAEERLGRCLSEVVAEGLIRREDLVIESKWAETIKKDGTYGPKDFSSDWLKRSIEISLNRLKTDYIDLYALHGECEQQYIMPLVKTLDDLKTQGLIRAYGVNTFNTEYIEWVEHSKMFDYVMLDYNILRQERELQIDKLYHAGIGVIAGAALAQSLHFRRFRLSRNELWYSLRSHIKFKEMKKRAKKFYFLSDDKEFSASQLALRYVLDNDMISSAVFNTTNEHHLKENVKAADIQMPYEIGKEIKKRGKE